MESDFSSSLPASDADGMLRLASSRCPESPVGAEIWVPEAELLRLLGLDEAEFVRAVAELSAIGTVKKDCQRRRTAVIRLVMGCEVATAETEYSPEFATALQQYVAHQRRAHAPLGDR